MADTTADAAAFFAKKNKKGAGKKKKFKAFNANKIDASTVSSNTHVDAQNVGEGFSTQNESVGGLGGSASLGLGVAGADSLGGLAGVDDGDQWADSAVATPNGNHVASATGATASDMTSMTSSTSLATNANANAPPQKAAELLDMEALSNRRSKEDDVAARLKIEETKAQLARAKEGMAKEAERLKMEKEFKTVTKGGKTMGAGAGNAGGNRFGNVKPMGGDSGKWVPVHMRAGGSGLRGPSSMPGLGSAMAGASIGNNAKVDTESAELFPDLAQADKIIAEKEERERRDAARMANAAQSGANAPNTPWGKAKAENGGVKVGAGGGGWGVPRGNGNVPAPVSGAPAVANERRKLNLAAPSKVAEKVEKKEKEVEKPAVASVEPVAAPAAAPAPAVAASSAPAEKKPIKKKKKKKDLSTFKPK